MRILRLFSALVVGATAALLAPSAHAQCVSNGPGGLVPDLNGIDGTWPSVLPTGELVSAQSVTVPGGATVIHSVKMTLKHTWVGDLQVVLESPSGAKYNIGQYNDGIFGGGCASDFFGVYEFVDPVGSNNCVGATTLPCGPNVIPSGTYRQEFGAWPTGSAGIDNVGLEQIPLANGTWKLYVYDWYIGFDNGALLNWELCFGQPTPPPPPPVNSMNCVGSGPGGFFPASGSADGTWPTVMPTGEFISPLAVSVPAGATKIVGVKVNGLSHTWYGDIQFVLQSPSGALYNIMQVNDGIFGGGCGDDFNGDYTFVDANVGQSGCGGPAPVLPCFGGTTPSGEYLQNFGLWPSGTNNIDNTPIQSIPLASGTWSLICYDWYVFADAGTFTSWELCFDGASGPSTFCPAQAPGSSNGCVPTIAATGNPNVAQNNSCVITVSNVEGQKSGIIFYGVNGTTVNSWCLGGNSFLCVKPPTQRTLGQNSGGTGGLCNGTLTLDWNAFQNSNPTALGNPFAAGTHAYVQGWFRDPPSCKTTFLSEGLDLTYVP
ncbi:MAG: proprotein convertase P-domain-containing protein [Planctomycetes bacterium]|nr:proprotein convertase P-domain-containing protein [Planctomycetota bacterium]